jgi:hypothetical protein
MFGKSQSSHDRDLAQAKEIAALMYSSVLTLGHVDAAEDVAPPDQRPIYR